MVTAMFTIPLYIFTALPPVEIIEEFLQETVLEVEVPVENQIEVNRTIQVQINVTKEVELNRTIILNVTEGNSIFLAPQAPPPLINSDIVIAVDTSASMLGTRMAIAKTAIRNLLITFNQTNNPSLKQDRVGLISFNGLPDFDWSNDAYFQTGLDFVGNQAHLNDVLTKTENLTTDGNTDIWAGLNLSLQLLLNNPRNSTSLQSIILLTDGVHSAGPWRFDVSNSNYTGFMQLPNTFSTWAGTPAEDGPYAESPVVVARRNGIKIHTIGLFEGSPQFDKNFLLNISKDPDYGTFGEFSEGNDTLSITESFLRARDSASGWVQLIANETIIQGNGTEEIFSFNVTESIHKLKCDLNWNNSLINFNLTIIDPNGTVIDFSKNLTDNIIQISDKQPKSVILDFPMQGEWQFHINWANVISSEGIKTRLATYEPPIYIESVTQSKTTEPGQNFTILFLVNVTNKNPLFSFHNITPVIVANFTQFNYTYSWNPEFVSEIPLNTTISFTLNFTLHSLVFVEGLIFIMVNSSEGYYDAYAQPLSLDYRITQKEIVETYFENQTITTYENQSIIMLENQTVFILEQNTVLSYNYNRQALDILKWIGLGAGFLLFSLILGIYFIAQEKKLRKLMFQFFNQFLQGGKSAEISFNRDLSKIFHLDELGTEIRNQTGMSLFPEELIKMASGVNTKYIADRISYVTGIPSGKVLQYISEASSVNEILQKLNLSYDELLYIISRDEEVLTFQKKIKSLIGTTPDPTSIIMSNEEIDVNLFRSQLRETKRNI
ncbi:MAG: vWA domain-containing protein [Candidatus Hodarchaeales archaeon]|jgi:hypothetical protein